MQKPISEQTEKKCRVCKTILTEKNTYLGTFQYKHWICKKCSCQKTKEWTAKNKERYNIRMQAWRANNKEYTKKYDRNRRLEYKLEILRHYSPELRCARCGFFDTRALTIDHINGGGNRQKRNLKITGGSGMYRWFKANGYPPGFQVLCMNCQFIKKEEQDEVYRGQSTELLASILKK